MNWRRYVLALIVASILTLIADVLLNAMVFRNVYTRSADLLLPVDRLNARVGLGWAALVVIVGAFGAMFAQGGWRGITGGLQFGSLLALATIAGVAGFASLLPWPPELLVAVGVQQLVNGFILGLTFGTLYRPMPRASAPATSAKPPTRVLGSP